MEELKEFKDTSIFPRGILAIFIMQFVFFLFYYNQNRDDEELLYIIVLIAIVGVIIATAKVILIVNKEEIKYGLFPLPKNKVKWDDIEKYDIIQISAFSDFLGMGLRSSKKYGKGYITDTKYALFIEKKNGNKVTISLKNKDEFELFLKEINKEIQISNP